MALSPDGSQLWVSNRYNGGVSVVDTGTGKVVATIRTGQAPHGLAFWPIPGQMSLGQNGNMR
jgi:YVTN family beta-propeller protein